MNDKEKLDSLLSVCHALAKAGQSPTVGLLRGKAPFKVSVLEAIETIKRFNQQQQLQQSLAKPQPKPDQIRIQELESRVSQLEHAISLLELRLTKLTQ